MCLPLLECMAQGACRAGRACMCLPASAWAQAATSKAVCADVIVSGLRAWGGLCVAGGALREMGSEFACRMCWGARQDGDLGKSQRLCCLHVWASSLQETASCDRLAYSGCSTPPSLAQSIPLPYCRRRCTAPSRAAPSRAPLPGPSAGAGEPRAGLAAPAPTLPISSWYSSGSTFSFGSTNSAKTAKPAAAQVLRKRRSCAAVAATQVYRRHWLGGEASAMQKAASTAAYLSSGRRAS